MDNSVRIKNYANEIVKIFDDFLIERKISVPKRTNSLIEYGLNGNSASVLSNNIFNVMTKMYDITNVEYMYAVIENGELNKISMLGYTIVDMFSKYLIFNNITVPTNHRPIQEARDILDRMNGESAHGIPADHDNGFELYYQIVNYLESVIK